MIALVIVYGWIQLYRFVRHFDSNGQYPFVPRPQFIDSFLPIGSLVALKNWVINGVFDKVHPAGLVIFVAVLVSAILLRRGFCSWVCPVGSLSELLWKFGNRVMGRNVKLGKHVDLFARSIKYLVLIFFLKAILLDMNSFVVYAFVNSPYYKIADVKMLDFFINPSDLTLMAIAFLVVMSFVVKNFWCRYICPYGALLGVMGLLSPFTIRRDVTKCTGCRGCSKACPVYLDVADQKKVTSPECMMCLECIESCHTNALHVKTIFPFRIFATPLKSWMYPAMLLAIFALVLMLGILTGNWSSSVSYSEYVQLIPLRFMITH
jgi:polyferredoxin